MVLLRKHIDKMEKYNILINYIKLTGTMNER